MKNYTLAVDQLEQSIGNRKQPTAEHYYRLGLAYGGKGDAAKAKQTMRKALDLNPKFEGAQEAKKILAH
jgi:tetratricopeptide (TPR) repeat protein